MLSQKKSATVFVLEGVADLKLKAISTEKKDHNKNFDKTNTTK